jgi:4-hydroxy-3-polyprenylbenzoate decarboxylase
MGPEHRKIVLAITGASGSLYAKTLVEKLQKLESPPAEIAVILSSTARDIWMDEIGSTFEPGEATKEYDNNTYYAPFASGSSMYDTMIICPASMGITGRIANGTSDDLIARTADVILKERRRLILVPREMPFSLIHVENLRKLLLAGAIVCPASPSFYSKPETIGDLINTVVDRILDLAGFKNNTYRWQDNG